MSYRVIVTPTADAEARESFRWYAARSPTAARRWHDGLKRALASLAENPNRSPVSEEDSESLGREVRLLLFGRRTGASRILYAVRAEVLRVLRIRHASRGPIEG